MRDLLPGGDGPRVVVICAAGLGSRFARAGFSVPKPAIEVAGRSLLEWSLSGLREALATVREVRVIVREELQLDELVRGTFASLDLPEPRTIVLREPTRGQAETVLRAVGDLAADDSFAVWNIDTLLREGVVTSLPAENWLHCFPSTFDRYSYVVAGTDGRVSRVAEKQVLSDWASSGLYFFARVDTFVEGCYRTYPWLAGTDAPADGQEAYVAPVYQTLLDAGQVVTAVRSEAGSVVPLGTPEEVDAARGLLNALAAAGG